MKKFNDIFYDELFKNVIPFWEKFGYDTKYGGMYTSLDRAGNLYSSDKSVWMQGRAGYMFANLYNEYNKDPKFLENSRSCIDFLENHCIDKDGRFYFIVTKEGKPLRKRRYYFSELFYVIACAEYYRATNNVKYLEKARDVFYFVYEIYENKIEDPYKITPKSYYETRPLKSLSLPMILLNTLQILRLADAKNEKEYTDIITKLLEEIKTFKKKNSNLLLETIGVDGTIYEDIASCRVINPGHSIEVSWFLLDEAEYRKDESLMEFAKNVFDEAYELGFDKTYGGLVYFKDYLNYPVEAYEHDMKLWWVHCETMIASLKLFMTTKNKKYEKIFKDITKYSFEKFSDPQNGEWFGYLRRDGIPTEPPCKGHLYKGPYHIPRMLVICQKILEKSNL